jgi:hypothetical protein
LEVKTDMNNKDNKLREMCLRVQECRQVLGGKIPDGSYAAELFTRLSQSLAQLDAHTSAQTRSARAVTESVSGKGTARSTLLDLLKAVGRTVKPLDKKIPGVANKFHVPGRLNDQDLLSLARVFATEVVPLQAELAKRGLSATLAGDIAAAAAAFEQAVGRKTLHKETRIASHATVKRTLRECTDIVRELDPIVRNLCDGDDPALAAWDSATHVQSATRRAKPDAKPDAQTPPPPQ